MIFICFFELFVLGSAGFLDFVRKFYVGLVSEGLEDVIERVRVLGSDRFG